MKLKAIASFSAIVLLVGCASNQNLPLVFSQSQTVGISIGADASEQGAEFVFGYKDKNVAVVPVSVQEADGSSSTIGSTSGEEFEDALSVLGQFEVNTKTNQGDVGLGKFFATGAAAKSLADGFSCKVAGGNAADCGFAEQGEEEVVVEDQ